MRTPPLRALVASTLLVLCAAPASRVEAQAPIPAAPEATAFPAQTTVDAETGARTLLGPAPVSDFAGATRRLQDPGDYSASAWFEREHGYFLQEAIRFRPQVQVQYGRIARTGTADEPGQFEFDDFRAEALFRQPVDPDTYLVLGGNFGSRVYEFTNTAQVGDETLYEASLELGAGYFVKEDLLAEVVLRPGVYSSFEGVLNSGDWQFFGDALLTWQAHSREQGHESPLYLKFGARYDETFNKVTVYPLLGATWLIDEQWRLDVLLPIEARISYQPSASWIFASGIDIVGDLYQYKDGAGRRLDARVQEMRLFLEGTYRFDDALSAFGRFGTTLTGEYDWQGFTGNVRTDYDGAIDPTFFFEFGVGVSF
ncbi:MAG: hypothetical protein IPM29_30690 [Planctomycetes bacterium]|nr:hypothetical protein [Planctomycetota bacterium]